MVRSKSREVIILFSGAVIPSGLWKLHDNSNMYVNHIYLQK